MKSYVYISLMVIAFIFGGCGGGSDNSGVSNIVSTREISGYVEDDPIPNAKIKLMDSTGKVVAESVADKNGKFTLSSELRDGKVYVLESEGSIGDRNITMHSVFKYASDSIININPITELKYRLVQDGKSIEHAEELIREYFLLFNGEKLEYDRFGDDDSLASDMKELAELSNKSLPLDAVEKIEKDIINNEGEKEKNYSFRSLFEKHITLEATAQAAKVGEKVTLRIAGLDRLNSHYQIRWSGIPQNTEMNKTSVSFTSMNAGDIYPITSICKIDGNVTKVLSSGSTKINFYKSIGQRQVTISNTDANSSFGFFDDDIVVPSGTLSEGDQIKIEKFRTESDNTISKIAIDTSVDNTNSYILYKYNYNPSLVAEPRNISIYMEDNSTGKITNILVKNINYNEHVITFKVPLHPNLTRAYSPFNSHQIVNIDYYQSTPSKAKILDFYITYKDYLKKIIDTFISDANKAEDIWNYLNSDIGQAKFVYWMKEKENGNYNFNLLAAAVNEMIAKEKAEKLQISYNDWTDAMKGYLLYRNTADIIFRGRYSDKIVKINDVISPWVGSVKLTKDQENLIRYARTTVNALIVIGSTIATGGGTGALYVATTGTAGIAVDLAWPSDLGGEAAGYALPVATNVVEFANKPVIIGAKAYTTAVAKDWAIGAGVNNLFKSVEEAMIYGNKLATAPIFLQIGFLSSQIDGVLNTILPLQKDGDNAKMYALPFTRSAFVDMLFPESINTSSEYYNDFVSYVRKTILNADTSKGESQLSENFDPNKRLEKLFLTKPNSNNGYISNEDRALAYLFLRYGYGDPGVKQLINNIITAGEFKGFQLLLQSIMLPNKYVADEKDMYVGWCLDPTTYNTVGTTFDAPYSYTNQCSENDPGATKVHIVKIKSEYEITSFDKLKNWLGFTRSLKKRGIAQEHIENIPNFDSFEKVLDIGKLKLTQEQIDNNEIVIEKVSLNIYGIGLEYSSDSNSWTPSTNTLKHKRYVKDGDINSLFTFNSESGKYELPLSELFSNEDLSLFDNKLIGMRVEVLLKKNGVEKLLKKDFIVSTINETQGVEDFDHVGSTLKSTVKDAVTGDPISNAQVTLIPGGLTDFTDENGNYEVSGLAAGTYTITVQKEGYMISRAELELGEDETKVFEVMMVINEDEYNETGSASITLRDAVNGNIIKNDYIKIREGQNNKTGEVIKELINDGNSTVNIALPTGIYTFEVGANGYTHSFNTVSIIGNVNKSYEFALSPVLSQDEVRIVLTWGETPYDLDSHLVRLNNGTTDYHVYYADMSPANADANLDVDDTDSYGPETITINSLDKNATYKYYVHDFSNGSDHNDTMLKSSGAKVEVYYGDQSRTFYVPNENGNVWKVFEIDNGEIVPCTNGCVFGVDGETDPNIGLRSLNRGSDEKAYFRNLPRK